MRFLLLAIAGCLLPFSAFAGLSLSDLQKAAIENNSDLRATQAEREVQWARRSQKAGAFWPRLGLETGYESARSSAGQDRGSYFYAFGEWRWPLGMGSYWDFAREEEGLRAANLRLIEERQKLEWKVAEIYYKWLMLDQSFQAYDKALLRNREQLKAAEKRRRAGLISDADIYEFDLYQTVLESDQEFLKADLEAVRAELAALTGVKVEELHGRPSGVLAHFHLQESVSDLLGRLPLESEELQRSESQVRQAEYGRRVEASAYWPELSLAFTQGQRDLDDNSAIETALMAKLRWEIFSGLTDHWSFRESKEREAVERAKFEQKRRDLESDVRQAHHRAKALEARVDLESANRERAQRYLKVITAEYQRGVKNSPDMRGANERVLESDLRDIKFRYDFLLQHLRLQQALGGVVAVKPGSQAGHRD